MARRCLAILLMLSLSTIIVHFPAAGFAQEPDQATECKAAIAAFAANQSSFPHYKCRYRQTKALAGTLEEALNGQWQNAESSEFRFAVDGQKELNECFAPPLTPPKIDLKTEPRGKINLRKVPATFSGGGYLSNGDHELSYSNVLRAINLYRLVTPYGGKPQPPLLAAIEGRDLDSPDRLLAKPDEWTPTFLGRLIIDGRPAIGVQFDGQVAGQIQSMQYFFDPAQGYLILRKRKNYGARLTDNGGTEYRTYLIEARECSRQRWFPGRTIIVSPTNVGNLKYALTEIRILELEADGKPSENDFTLQVPVGTEVLEYHDYAKRPFRLKQDEKINVDDLPALFEMLDKAQNDPQMDTALPSRRGMGWLRWLGISVGVALVASAVYLAIRRRRAQPNSRPTL